MSAKEGTLSVSALADEERAHSLGSWDQFQGNKHLIRAVSTYDEQLYTTPIPANISKEWLERARHISQEKETPDTGHVEAEDEEMQHCGVRRQKITHEATPTSKIPDEARTLKSAGVSRRSGRTQGSKNTGSLYRNSCHVSSRFIET